MAIRACALWLLALLTLLPPAFPARAQTPALSAALAEKEIILRAGFDGAEVLLFGALEGARGNNVELIITLSGPPRSVRLRRKEKIVGLWVNRSQALFDDMPAYFALASNLPLDAGTQTRFTPRAAGQYHGAPALEHLDQLDQGFDAALARLMAARGLWHDRPRPLRFLGPSLFHAKFFIPPLAPPGLYHADVFLRQGGEMRHQQRLSFDLAHTGLAQRLLAFAHAQPFLYGLAAIFLALAVGWAVPSFFARRR